MRPEGSWVVVPWSGEATTRGDEEEARPGRNRPAQPWELNQLVEGETVAAESGGEEHSGEVKWTLEGGCEVRCGERRGDGGAVRRWCTPMAGRAGTAAVAAPQLAGSISVVMTIASLLLHGWHGPVCCCFVGVAGPLSTPRP